MLKALEKRGVPRPVVMAGVAVDTASCYATYVLGLGAALLITLVHHQASGLVLFASIPFAAGGIGVTVAVLLLSGRRTGAVAESVARVGPVRKMLQFFADADRRLVRRPAILLEASACQLAILLIDAATIWVLIAALGATATPTGVFASFMISTLFRIVGFVPGGLRRLRGRIGADSQGYRGWPSDRAGRHPAVSGAELLASHASGALVRPSRRGGYAFGSGHEDGPTSSSSSAAVMRSTPGGSSVGRSATSWVISLQLLTMLVNTSKSTGLTR